MAKIYQINEIFYSIQGEGILAGTPMVFVRFSRCNMKCDLEPSEKSPGGFKCDTEFESGFQCSLEKIEQTIKRYPTRWLLLTGGEPGLQVDMEFCLYFRARGYSIAIETNGSILLPHDADADLNNLVLEDALDRFPFNWITVSPKVAEHAIEQRWAHEVRYVRGHGQAIPKTRVQAFHHLVSPAFDGLELDQETIQHCSNLVKDNPEWRLSVQMHKSWRVR